MRRVFIQLLFGGYIGIVAEVGARLMHSWAGVSIPRRSSGIG